MPNGPGFPPRPRDLRQLSGQLKNEDSLAGDADLGLITAGFAALPGHLAGQRPVDPALDAEPLMREMLRSFLR